MVRIAFQAGLVAACVQRAQTQATLPPLRKCGIASSLGACQKDLDFLKDIKEYKDDVIVSCMGYGGTTDPCTLSITNDFDYETNKYTFFNKDPRDCKGGVFFLWDEPYTQAERAHEGKFLWTEWATPEFLAQQWKDYTTEWSQALREARRNGLKVTTPLFTDKATKHDDYKVSTEENIALQQMDTFFKHCPACNEEDNDQYIDILAWNAWLGDWDENQESDYKGQADWVKRISGVMKEKWPGAGPDPRPVVLSNWGYLDDSATSEKQVKLAIQETTIFDTDDVDKEHCEGPCIDSVYYFAAADFNDPGNDGIPAGANLVSAPVGGGSTIGRELLKKCSAGSSPTPAPTPPPERCHACLTMCDPCQACVDSKSSNCDWCWHCWDWDHGKLKVDDEHMHKHKDCDAMDPHHKWTSNKARCLADNLANDQQDCRACWSEKSLFV